MDLLSPCRSCLQCLPFVHVSPPSSPRRSSEASRSEHGHWHASPHSEAPVSQQALDSSKGSGDELCKGDNFSQPDTAMALHGAEDNDGDRQPHHVQVAVPPLSSSSSTPELDTEADIGSVSSTDVVPAMEESYHSDSLSDAASPRRRRRYRELLKDQITGITQQIKRAGLQMKKESSKHMQKIMENMNKPAQQIGESGSFSTAPRANNN